MVWHYLSPTSVTSNLQGFAIWWQLFIPMLMTTSLVRHYIHKILIIFFTVFVSVMYCKYLQRDRALPIAGKAFTSLEFDATQAIPHYGLLCFSDSQVRVSQFGLSVAYLSTLVCKSTLKEDCVMELRKRRRRWSPWRNMDNSCKIWRNTGQYYFYFGSFLGCFIHFFSQPAEANIFANACQG